VAIDALAQLPDTTLTISGRGEASYVASLEERARANGVRDRVTFTVTPRDRLRTLYASADAFLFPVTWDEPFGLTPVEAMACATPVVGTARAGSLDFLVDGTNCLAVESDDATALARAVERLRADDELRQRIVRGGLETASKLTVDRYAHTLEAWHRFAAGEGDQPA
jgi:glycosyltransferase involved in cell wall biosynthesis